MMRPVWQEDLNSVVHPHHGMYCCVFSSESFEVHSAKKWIRFVVLYWLSVTTCNCQPLFCLFYLWLPWFQVEMFSSSFCFKCEYDLCHHIVSKSSALDEAHWSVIVVMMMMMMLQSETDRLGAWQSAISLFLLLSTASLHVTLNISTELFWHNVKKQEHRQRDQKHPPTDASNDT